MRIAIVTDKSRMELLPSEEGFKEDEQKRESVEEVKRILSKKHYCISLIVDDNIINKLKAKNIDLVFNLCNGIRGDSKLSQLPGILEFAGIPYTGSSILGHTLAANKNYSSKIFKAEGIPTPAFIPINSIHELENINMPFPIMIKPNDEGSSRGIHQSNLVFDMESLIEKVDEQLRLYNPPIILNEYIEGREFSVGIIGNESLEVLPIKEIDLTNLPDNLLKFYSFEVKTHYEKNTIYHIPAILTPEEESLIKETAIKAYKSLMLRDYSRVDIIFKDNVPYVLEINSLPGLMKGRSALYKMAEASDLGYENLVLKIVDIAMKRYKLNNSGI